MTSIVNGWKILLFTDFKERYEALRADVSVLLRAGNSVHPKVKFLRRLNTIIFEEVPQDPASAKYLLGNTIGAESRHWRRVKFNRRFRLFFWFSAKQQTIVFAYLNDESSFRKEGAKTDPYILFKAKLVGGHPPNNWADLLAASADEETQ